MKKLLYIIIIFFICFFCLSLVIADVTPELVQNSGIVIENGLISARLKDIPLSRVFSELKKKGNIQVKGGDEFNGKKITVNFRNLLIDKGISRILYGLNYSLVSNSDGSVKEIIILEGSSKSGQSIKNDDVLRRYNSNPEDHKIEASSNTSPDEEYQEKPQTVSHAIPADVSRINKPPVNINKNNPGISSLLKKEE